MESKESMYQRQALVTSSMINKKVSCSNYSSSSLSASSSTSSSTQQQLQQPPQHHLTANIMDGKQSPLVDMKMIDFAHTTNGGFADEITYEGPDDGYLFGLQNMITIFEEIKLMSSAEQQLIISSLNSDSLHSFNVNGKI